MDKNSLDFYFQNKLIYYNDSLYPQICLPKCFEKEIFTLTYDKNTYVGFHWVY